ncbi:aldo/keto reductase [Rhodococcus opacus]|nr:aldo/keto reductase [Rhodococcus opacus]
MEQRSVGASGLRVSRLGLGTLTWGRDTDGDEAAAQIASFVDAGGTLVDTSPAYGDGVAQRILAELLDDVVPRTELVLSSSSGINPAGPSRIDCSRRGLVAQLDATLRELGTDYLDMWQVATWDPFTPVDEVAATLDFAVSSGRVRYVGARGYLGWQLATAAGASRGTTLVATQVSTRCWRGASRRSWFRPRRTTGSVCSRRCPRPGVLTGKYRNGIPVDSRGADDAHAQDVQSYLTDSSVRVVDAVVTAADGLGTSPLAVALAWARDRPGVASAVVGARDIAQLTGVLVAEELELPAAIAAALDDVSA